MTDEFCGSGVADKIAFLAGFAPFSFRIPVPSLNVKLGVLTIGNGLPACGEELLDHGFGEDLIGSSQRNTIDACAQGFGGTKGALDVIRGDVNAYSLSCSLGRKRFAGKKKHGDQESRGHACIFSSSIHQK